MKISAVITDNASTMTAAWRILKQEYKHIIFMGCTAHGLNLLVGDIMQLDWAMKIFSNAKKLLNFLKNILFQVPFLNVTKLLYIIKKLVLNYQ